MKTEDWTLKEIVSATLALLLVGFAIWLMYTISTLSEAESAGAKYQRLSSLLQVAVGLAGTATGYYFGRVPAEKTAAAAQHNAKEAQNTVVVAAQKAASASEQLRELRRVVGGKTPTGGAIDGQTLQDAATARIDLALGTLS